MHKVLIELAVFHPGSVVLAEELSLPRIELCQDYASGGVSPDPAIFRSARRHYRGQLFVMVRSRPGNFVYSRQDCTKMLELARFFKDEGADGIVSGFLDADDTIEERQLEEMLAAIAPLPFTFHRAFDRIVNKARALETLIQYGCERVLSSGGAASALQGIAVLKELHEQAASRIIILPGGGIRAANLNELLQQVPFSEIHTAAIESGEVASRRELEGMG